MEWHLEKIFFIKEAVFIKISYENSNLEKQEKRVIQRLLSIAVSRDAQRQNIAYSMEKFFCGELLKKNIKEVGLSVKKDNNRAINFYKKCGYQIEKEEEKNIYFIKKLI